MAISGCACQNILSLTYTANMWAGSSSIIQRNTNRMLSDYFLQDARLSYAGKCGSMKSIRLFVQANNIFSKKYEANGYSFSYIYGGKLTTENYYFPMAPFNIMTGLNIIL